MAALAHSSFLPFPPLSGASDTLGREAPSTPDLQDMLHTLERAEAGRPTVAAPSSVDTSDGRPPPYFCTECLVRCDDAWEVVAGPHTGHACLALPTALEVLPSTLHRHVAESLRSWEECFVKPQRAERRQLDAAAAHLDAAQQQQRRTLAQLLAEMAETDRQIEAVGCAKALAASNWRYQRRRMERQLRLWQDGCRRLQAEVAVKKQQQQQQTTRDLSTAGSPAAAATMRAGAGEADAVSAVISHGWATAERELAHLAVILERQAAAFAQEEAALAKRAAEQQQQQQQTPPSEPLSGGPAHPSPQPTARCAGEGGGGPADVADDPNNSGKGACSSSVPYLPGTAAPAAVASARTECYVLPFVTPEQEEGEEMRRRANVVRSPPAAAAAAVDTQPEADTRLLRTRPHVAAVMGVSSDDLYPNRSPVHGKRGHVPTSSAAEFTMVHHSVSGASGPVAAHSPAVAPTCTSSFCPSPAAEARDPHTAAEAAAGVVSEEDRERAERHAKLRQREEALTAALDAFLQHHHSSSSGSNNAAGGTNKNLGNHGDMYARGAQAKGHPGGTVAQPDSPPASVCDEQEKESTTSTSRATSVASLQRQLLEILQQQHDSNIHSKGCGGGGGAV